VRSALVKEWERALATRPTATVAVDANPVDFARSVGIEPDDWQSEVLTSNHPRKILCCGRQTGKSTVAAVLSIHKALTMPGVTVLVVAPGRGRPSSYSVRRHPSTSGRDIPCLPTRNGARGWSCPTAP
jgi:hypothetical protein